jgi:hypothetical protein
MCVEPWAWAGAPLLETAALGSNLEAKRAQVLMELLGICDFALHPAGKPVIAIGLSHLPKKNEKPATREAFPARPVAALAAASCHTHRGRMDARPTRRSSSARRGSLE